MLEASLTAVRQPRHEWQKIRSGLEDAYREAARLADDAATRVRLVDQANSVRLRSLT